MPASGPMWPARRSATSGNPNAAKRARIVIGVEHDLGDLRPQARDDMGEQRPSAKRQQRLVAAAHAARFAAGKHDPDDAVQAFACRDTMI